MWYKLIQGDLVLKVDAKRYQHSRFVLFVSSLSLSTSLSNFSNTTFQTGITPLKYLTDSLHLRFKCERVTVGK